MSFWLFTAVVILTALLGVSSAFFIVKRKKYGVKKMWGFIGAFIISLIIVIPLGNQPLTGDYKKNASEFSYDKYLSESIPVGTHVKIEGQVISLDDFNVDSEEVFILESDEGTFYVKNNNVDNMEIKDGEILTIYGGYAGNGKNGNSPSINAQIIDKE